MGPAFVVAAVWLHGMLHPGPADGTAYSLTGSSSREEVVSTLAPGHAACEDPRRLRLKEAATPFSLPPGTDSHTDLSCLTLPRPDLRLPFPFFEHHYRLINTLGQIGSRADRRWCSI